MSFKDISYVELELRQPLCSMEWNHLSSLVECIKRNISVKLF